MAHAQNDTQHKESDVHRAPVHLNSTGCQVRHTQGKGRGVFASREISRNCLIEVSPVLLFTADEYQEHGRHTVLDHYTFKWRDGRMALALGLGSLFNHSRTPNVSYSLDPDTESIRYTTTRAVKEGEELCIFYGHQLWFKPAGIEPQMSLQDEKDDGWGGLFSVGDDVEPQEPEILEGPLHEIIPDAQLPFIRMKLVDDEAEDDIASVRTESAWVVDVPEARYTNVLLKWLKQSGLETTNLAHLKRVRKNDGKTSLLLTTVAQSPEVPLLPADVDLPGPYIIDVPRNPALTLESLKAKTTFWPTIYAPRKKGELEPMTRGEVRWAWEAMRTVVHEAKAARERGELPIVAYVPVPYHDETKTSTQLLSPVIAHDTRNTTRHPLRHAVLNLVRKVADYRAQPAPMTTPISEPPPPSASEETSEDSSSTSRNGSHYLLTSLALFISHEPCIMCSMALLHSRVKEVYYLKSMTKTGGCGGSTCVPKLDGVNHRFSLMQWSADGAGLGDSALDLDEGVDA